MHFFRIMTSLLACLACQTETVPLVPQPEAESTTRQPAGEVTPAARLRLKQMSVSGDNSGLGPLFVTTLFDYNQALALRQVTVPPTSPFAPELIKDYTYDQQGRVSSFVELPKSGDNHGTIHSFTYSDSGFTYSFRVVGPQGQDLPDQNNPSRDVYRINGQGQLTEWLQEGIIRYGRPTRARYVYRYENGNIVQATYLNGDDKEEFTIRYQYDDKVNPFYGWMYTIDPVLRYSRNNVVVAQIDQSAPFRTEYTYNDLGYPLTKKDVTKGAVLTYEYELY